MDFQSDLQAQLANCMYIGIKLAQTDMLERYQEGCTPSDCRDRDRGGGSFHQASLHGYNAPPSASPNIGRVPFFAIQEIKKNRQ
jgi:hypothetical protein